MVWALPGRGRLLLHQVYSPKFALVQAILKTAFAFALEGNIQAAVLNHRPVYLHEEAFG